MNSGADHSPWLLFTNVIIFNCSGPNRGHYIAIVKSHDFWLLFDDDIVEVSAFVWLHNLILISAYFFFLKIPCGPSFSCRKSMRRP